MASVSTDRRRGINSSAAIKAPCIAASTGNLTLSAEQTVDGIALVAGDRCFAKDQTDTTEIGIYVVASSTWARAVDFDGTYDVVEGTIVPVSRGTVNSDTYWKISNTGTITIGTTSLTVAATTVLSSAILSDGSVRMAAHFQPVAAGTYSLGVSTGTWTSIHLSSAVNANSAAISSDVIISGALKSSGTVTASSNATITGTATLSSNATIAGTLASSGAVTLSTALIASLLTTGTAGTDPGVSGRLWVSTSTGATAGKFLLVSTGA